MSPNCLLCLCCFSVFLVFGLTGRDEGSGPPVQGSRAAFGCQPLASVWIAPDPLCPQTSPLVFSHSTDTQSPWTVPGGRSNSIGVV